jgi:hypothetical protein
VPPDTLPRRQGRHMRRLIVVAGVTLAGAALMCGQASAATTGCPHPKHSHSATAPHLRSSAHLSKATTLTKSGAGHAVAMYSEKHKPADKDSKKESDKDSVTSHSLSKAERKRAADERAAAKEKATARAKAKAAAKDKGKEDTDEPQDLTPAQAREAATKAAQQEAAQQAAAQQAAAAKAAAEQAAAQKAAQAKLLAQQQAAALAKAKQATLAAQQAATKAAQLATKAAQVAAAALAQQQAAEQASAQAAAERLLTAGLFSNAAVPTAILNRLVLPAAKTPAARSVPRFPTTAPSLPNLAKPIALALDPTRVGLLSSASESQPMFLIVGFVVLMGFGLVIGGTRRRVGRSV